nr:tetratricopeptide repeat protein [Gammaproteobacteria bacterium]NIQ11010.1 tetratricopeptide repeat protein [Gammaproteobacteria bacterium]NIR25772.1 tetratricopeptide repeat protein [Gammaproteobacteria bacterium]NIY20255.1 tetratricopeptide repeat protein [Gammaproteobacteria bacterium]
MASKDKLLANAQKFLSKGQIPKAIGEYQKLVEANPKDVRNRQKLAELLSREKRNEEALTEYEAVAKHYTETGFYLKAIAVFKQMQKIEPSRVDIYHRLAELNEKQGLVGNALTEYRNLVSFYDQNEMHYEAIEVLEKMAELDPDNLNVAAKIAESYKATDQTDEALQKFQEIISPLASKGEHTKVIKLYERFLDICPEEGTSRLPLAVSLLNTGSAEKAIQILKGLLKHSPEDADVNKALTDAYVANQDYANARLTLKHLLKQKDKD